jgi:hypothetical protein
VDGGQWARSVLRGLKDLSVRRGHRAKSARPGHKDLSVQPDRKAMSVQWDPKGLSVQRGHRAMSVQWDPKGLSVRRAPLVRPDRTARTEWMVPRARKARQDLPVLTERLDHKVPPDQPGLLAQPAHRDLRACKCQQDRCCSYSRASRRRPATRWWGRSSKNASTLTVPADSHPSGSTS